MSANFTPDFGNYTGVKPFRYWVQTVMPLVYDDSLSYMELLAKVVDYLNKVIEDNNTMIENVNLLTDLYNELKKYVDDYFTNLDVQEEINNKLDNMAQSGELSQMISNYFGLWVTPMMYGAVGDGVTDDTAPLRECLSKPFVMFPYNKRYKITESIDVTSNFIRGNNSIIDYFGESTRGILNLNSEVIIDIKDLIINGNNNACYGLFIYRGYNENDLNEVSISGCVINDLDNLQTTYGCAGISCDRSVLTSTNISNNIISNIHKTTSLAGTTSATGIIITRNVGHTMINNNIINNILSDELVDCDGIALYNLHFNDEAQETGTAELLNNKITNAIGRFFKVQGRGVKIEYNLCYLDSIEVMPTFRVVDFQTGSGEFNNNKIKFNRITGGASLQLAQVSSRNYNIDNNIFEYKNNDIVSDVNIPYGIIISGVFSRIMAVNIENNSFPFVVRPIRLITNVGRRSFINMNVFKNYWLDTTEPILVLGGTITEETQWNNLFKLVMMYNTCYSHTRSPIGTITDGAIITPKVCIKNNNGITPIIVAKDWDIKRLSTATDCYCASNSSFINTPDDFPREGKLNVLWFTGSRCILTFVSATQGFYILDTANV